MTTEYLKGPSNSYGDMFGTSVARQPLVYLPTSTAEVNRARLPGVDELRGMELAYREQFYTDAELRRDMNKRLLVVYFGGLLITLLIALLGSVLPLEYAITGAGILSILLGLNLIMNRAATTERLILYVAVPGLAVVSAGFLAAVLNQRLFACIVLGAITVLAYRAHGHKPFAFYHGWLYAAPRIRPATRKNPEPIPVRPNYAALIAIIATAVIVPLWSPTLGIAGVVGISLFFARDILKPRELLGRFRVVFGQYLTYGEGSTTAPGVWMPDESLRFRLWNSWRLVLPLFLTLATGLHLFAPWDVLRWTLRQDMEPGAMAELMASPFAWIFFAGESIAAGKAVYLWVLPVALALSIVVPILVLAAVYQQPLAAAADLRRRIEGKGADAIDHDPSRCEWEWYRDRMKDSPHESRDPMNREKKIIREADHLFFGVEPHAQFPVLIDPKVLSEHAYIVGDTGSGKTSLGIMPLLIQLLRGSAVPGQESNPAVRTEPPPMVVIDLKGDPALFHTVRHEALERRRMAGITDESDPRYAFRFFTPEPDHDSHIFNPFDSMKTESRTDMQLCHLLLDSLSLNHGEGYGRSYYSRRSRLLLYQALTHADNESGRPASIGELNAKLNRFVLPKGDVKHIDAEFGSPNDAFELLATFHTLANYPRLAVATRDIDPIHCIHMPQLLEHRQVAYFWLPSALESISVREIAKLALFSLLSAAIDRDRSRAKGGSAPVEPRQAFLVIDEFQRIAGENFKIILEQARSFGISAILANQTQQDLRTPDVDLRPTIRSNTRTKMYFSVTDPNEERELSEASGEELAELKTVSISGSSRGDITTSYQQSLKFRLTRNDIMSASDHPNDCILKVSRGAGYTQFAGMPIAVRTTYPMTEETYKQRQREPWPKFDVPAAKPVKPAKELERESKAAIVRGIDIAIDILRPKPLTRDDEA